MSSGLRPPPLFHYAIHPNVIGYKSFNAPAQLPITLLVLLVIYA
jgi:hypothetical protein